jgi:peptidoglycan/xylan/chitin deacetylase (PgdA/CDA1 family)
MSQISLLYHDVVGHSWRASGFTGADADIYKLDEENFAAHLARIAELGSERVDWLMTDRGRADRVVLTFDDGGVSADEPISRMLEAHGWRGCFFIVTERVGQPGFLSREQVRSLHRRGHHIGSHSHSHPPSFSTLAWEAMVREWSESRRILEEIVGERVYSASVPGGYYSRQVARSARRAGYTLMFNSEPTSRERIVDGISVRGRYGIWHQTSPETARALARGDVLPRARQAVLWNAKKPVKRIGGRVWLRFRRWFLERSAR